MSQEENVNAEFDQAIIPASHTIPQYYFPVTRQPFSESLIDGSDSLNNRHYINHKNDFFHANIVVLTDGNRGHCVAKMEKFFFFLSSRNQDYVD